MSLTTANRAILSSPFHRKLYIIVLRQNPIEDGAISGFSGQKSVPE